MKNRNKYMKKMEYTLQVNFLTLCMYTVYILYRNILLKIKSKNERFKTETEPNFLLE